MTQPAPEMPPKPTAEVSEDADTVTENTGQTPTVDPMERLNESAHARNLRLVAENTNLRFVLMQRDARILELEQQVEAAIQTVEDVCTGASLESVLGHKPHQLNP